jgi:hypothetical protein
MQKKFFYFLFFLVSFTFSDINLENEFFFNFLNQTESVIKDRLKETSFINTKYSYSEYDAYLDELFSPYSFSQILYAPIAYSGESGTFILLFKDETIASVIFQTIQSQDNFLSLLVKFNKLYGKYSHSSDQQDVKKYIWDTPKGKIFVSFLASSIGSSPTPFLPDTINAGILFIEQGIIDIPTSFKVWKKLREHNILDANGKLVNYPIEKELESVLEEFNFSQNTIEKIKNKITATIFGKTNIIFLKEDNLFM